MTPRQRAERRLRAYTSITGLVDKSGMVYAVRDEGADTSPIVGQTNRGDRVIGVVDKLNYMVHLSATNSNHMLARRLRADGYTVRMGQREKVDDFMAARG